MPRDLSRFRNQIEGSSRERRHMQRLANRADAFGPTTVLVDKDASTCEIQQRNAA
jgi:hypothetical protein